MFHTVQLLATCKSNLIQLHTGCYNVSWYTHFDTHKGNISIIKKLIFYLLTEMWLRDLRFPPRCGWVLRSSVIYWPLNVGPISYLETSVKIYHYTLSNIAKGRRSYLRFINSSFPHTSSYLCVHPSTDPLTLTHIYLLLNQRICPFLQASALQ
jgi:hypothetical protein